MEKVWKNCWGLRRIWENISALSLQQSDGSIFVGADLSPDRDNENALDNSRLVGKMILRMTT